MERVLCHATALAECGQTQQGVPTGVVQTKDMAKEAAEAITLEEVRSSIARLKSKKAPGFVGYLGKC